MWNLGKPSILHLFLFTIIFACWSHVALADAILWKQIEIPMAAAGPAGLETLLVWPNTPGQHPLALISHGSPRNPHQRPEMTAMAAFPIAMEFARRGFAVAVVMRRGYGHSGGGWAESYGSCDSPNYMAAALAAVTDLHTAIAYLATLPQFDTQRMIAVGVSAGGFATVALTANSPPGLVAAISFAGGRGSTISGSVCKADTLINTFSAFGKTSRIPMLWVYAINDHYFNPEIAKKLFTAFTKNGGKATFIQAPAFGDDGHFLFSPAGIPEWTPYVDSFLTSHHLVLVDKLLPLAAVSNLTPPARLSASGKKAYFKYLLSAPHKAFAVSANGSYGWRTAQYSIAAANQQALEYCQDAGADDCKIIAAE